MGLMLEALGQYMSAMAPACLGAPELPWPAEAWRLQPGFVDAKPGV